MVEWIKNNRDSLIRGSFLIPIVLVMAISISHVVSWYNLANPFNWAIYLSIAIEIAAMSSIAAASVKIKGGVWIVFIIVTLIQFIGNIFYCFNDINVNSKEFKTWVELTTPLFELFSDYSNTSSQKRWLALLEGGLLPIISLASLHFFMKYGDNKEEVVVKDNVVDKEEVIETKDETKSNKIETDSIWDLVKTLKKEGKLPPDPTPEELLDEPTALANSGLTEVVMEDDGFDDIQTTMDEVTNTPIEVIEEIIETPIEVIEEPKEEIIEKPVEVAIENHGVDLSNRLKTLVRKRKNNSISRLGE